MACRTIGAAVTKAASGDRIEVAAGTYPERLALDKDLEIRGAGALSTIVDGGAMDSVVSIITSTHIIMTRVTIRNGASYKGGGIMNLGALTLEASIITSSIGAYGGGLYNDGIAMLTNVVINGNSTNSTEPYWGMGGGIYNDRSVQLVNVSLSKNAAWMGGGIYNWDLSSALLINVTLSGNKATTGGGFYNGLFSTATLTNSTIYGNSASSGSGIYNRGTCIPHHCEGSDYFQLSNTIVANNTQGQNCAGDNRPEITSLGHNLASDASCSLNAPGDRNGADPLLGPLQNNGGPTPTHALLWASPAVDGADASHCPATDQRGVGRPLDGNQDGAAICDIGAYEYEFQRAFLYLPLITRALEEN